MLVCDFVGDGVESAFSILTFATYNNVTESICQGSIFFLASCEPQ